MSNDPSKLNYSRRGFVLGSLGVLLTGCAPMTAGLVGSGKPGPPWPTYGPRPRVLDTMRYPPLTSKPSPGRVVTIQQFSRSQWTRARPILSRLNPMNGMSCITIHHEGWTAVDFTDVGSAAARLEKIRRSHLDRLGAGDIGYHFIIDRAGRVWEGRSLAYQGAHAGHNAAGENNNLHNIGIMVLGNFNIQSPTREQYATLSNTLVKLMKQHRIAQGNIYTHQELAPTLCPGTVLQHHMVMIRRQGITVS